MGESSKSNAGKDGRRGSGSTGSQRGSGPGERLEFRTYEAHEHNEDVLSEAHAAFWCDQANMYIKDGYDRLQAAKLATQDFHMAVKEQARQRKISEAQHQEKIIAQIEQFELEEMALKESQKETRRRRHSTVKEQEKMEEEVRRRNTLAANLSRAPNGRRRRAPLPEREEARIARESEEHINYLKHHG